MKGSEVAKSETAKQRKRGGKGRESRGGVRCRKGMYWFQEVREVYEKWCRAEWGEVRMLSKAGKEGVRSEAKSGGRSQGGGNGKEEK